MKIRKSQIIMDILAIASFAGAHYLRVFAQKKIGFVRWLNYYEAKLSGSGSADTVRHALLILTAVLAAAAVLFALRHRKSIGLNGIIMCAVMLCAAAYCAFASVRFDYAYSQAYFLIIPVLWLGTLFLVIRSFILPAGDGSGPEK